MRFLSSPYRGRGYLICFSITFSITKTLKKCQKDVLMSNQSVDDELNLSVENLRNLIESKYVLLIDLETYTFLE